MKKYLVIFGILLSITACKTEGEKQQVAQLEEDTVDYTSIGEVITADAAKSIVDMAKVYKTLHLGDTINTKMVGIVDEVCPNKGCWMKISLDDGEQIMVKFKDYGFFMPKDIAGQEIIMDGKAFVNEVPVDELRHYAEDAGKSAEEIAAITQPKTTLSFEAKGVLLKTE